MRTAVWFIYSCRVWCSDSVTQCKLLVRVVDKTDAVVSDVCWSVSSACYSSRRHQATSCRAAALAGTWTRPDRLLLHVGRPATRSYSAEFTVVALLWHYAARRGTLCHEPREPQSYVLVLSALASGHIKAPGNGATNGAAKVIPANSFLRTTTHWLPAEHSAGGR